MTHQTPTPEQVGPVSAFEKWHAEWWKNEPNEVAHSNAFSAFIAGWTAALAAAPSQPVEGDWTQAHYVTRNSTANDPRGYRCWLTCRCGWDSGTLPDGNIPTSHRAELEHYSQVAALAAPASAEPECGCGAVNHKQWCATRDTSHGVTGHDFLPVIGHPDDDECTYRNDGTDLTYCGQPRDAHITESACTCPSGDGSLRWPCPSHPPTPAEVREDEREHDRDHLGICLNCGEGVNVRELLDGPTPCLAAPAERDAHEVDKEGDQ